MRFGLYGSVKCLYQWDSGIKLQIFGAPEVMFVHYETKRTARAIVVETKLVKHDVVADIPNELLTQGEAITAFAYEQTADGGYVKHSQTFFVIRRQKPESYIYTETETISYENLDGRIQALEAEGGDVQADWDENDENASGYVKNRTHYVASEEEMIEFANDWAAFESAWSADAACTFYDRASDTYYKNVPCDMDGTNSYGNPAFVWEFGKNKVAYDVVFHEIEVSPEGADLMVVKYTDTVHPLDEKFIPDTIARVSEIPQSDWDITDEDEAGFIKNKPEILQPDYDQSDETAADYIKNRPFYEKEFVVSELETINAASDDVEIGVMSPARYSLEKTYAVVINGERFEGLTFDWGQGYGATFRYLGRSPTGAFSDGEFAIFALRPGSEFPDITTDTTLTWQVSASFSPVESIYIIDEASSETKQLDDKFISDRIARVTNTVTPEQLDEAIDAIDIPTDYVKSVNNTLPDENGDVTISMGGGAETLVVNISADDQGNLSADKTFAEIKAEADSGASVWCVINGIWFSLVLHNDSHAFFEVPMFAQLEGYFYGGFDIKSDNTIEEPRMQYPDVQGATDSNAGWHGLVPAPAAGDQNKVLSGAGTWVDMPTDEYINKLIEAKLVALGLISNEPSNS